MYTPLLERQLKHYLKNTSITPEWQGLLDAIDRSYRHFERDHILGKQSLEISSSEFQMAAKKEKELQQQLISTARQAGMMQVATSVLHNVGNVLNSVNISATLLQEIFGRSELNSLKKIAQMIQEHRKDLAIFLTCDPRGMYVPDLLTALAESWQKEYTQALHELELLLKNIQHIKDIIAMQQKIGGGVIGINERVSIHVLLDDLVHMLDKELESHKISVCREYSNVPEVLLDRGRLFQILINLIRNAIDALQISMSKKKILTLRTRLEGNQVIYIDVMDNADGITRENLVKIFSFGFTTKAEGHGFGLHTSALLAKEMGGTLLADSQGIGQGAVFTLILPYETN